MTKDSRLKIIWMCCGKRTYRQASSHRSVALRFVCVISYLHPTKSDNLIKQLFILFLLLWECIGPNCSRQNVREKKQNELSVLSVIKERCKIECYHFRASHKCFDCFTRIEAKEVQEFRKCDSICWAQAWNRFVVDFYSVEWLRFIR